MIDQYMGVGSHRSFPGGINLVAEPNSKFTAVDGRNLANHLGCNLVNCEINWQPQLVQVQDF